MCQVVSRIASSIGSKPTGETMTLLRDVILKMKSKKVAACLKRVEDPQLAVFGDSGNAILRDAGSQGGLFVCLLPRGQFGQEAHVFRQDKDLSCLNISWKSNRIKRVARSPFRAEALIISDALDNSLWFQRGLEEMDVLSCKPLIVTDCMSVRVCAYAPAPSTTERGARIDLSALIEAVELGDMDGLIWVDRWRMIADALASTRAEEPELLYAALEGSWTCGLSAQAQNRMDNKKEGGYSMTTLRKRESYWAEVGFKRKTLEIFTGKYSISNMVKIAALSEKDAAVYIKVQDEIRNPLTSSEDQVEIFPKLSSSVHCPPREAFFCNKYDIIKYACGSVVNSCVESNVALSCNNFVGTSTADSVRGMRSITRDRGAPRRRVSPDRLLEFRDRNDSMDYHLDNRSSDRTGYQNRPLDNYRSSGRSDHGYNLDRESGYSPASGYMDEPDLDRRRRSGHKPEFGRRPVDYYADPRSNRSSQETRRSRPEGHDWYMMRLDELAAKERIAYRVDEELRMERIDLEKQRYQMDEELDRRARERRPTPKVLDNQGLRNNELSGHYAGRITVNKDAFARLDYAANEPLIRTVCRDESSVECWVKTIRKWGDV